MISSLYTATTGMEAQTIRINNIANNLANVNTTGFKQARENFQDLLYETERMPGLTSYVGSEIPSGIQVGLGVRVVSVSKNFSMGDLIQTGRELDCAIEGKGFFQMAMPDGTVGYTRAGHFQINNAGLLVSPDGYPVEPAVTIPDDATSIFIGADGTVSASTAGAEAPTELGTVELVNFINPSGLRAIGRNCFMETLASGTPTPGTPGEGGLGTIAHGFLENSNVNIAEELVSMIIAQRAYEVNSKVIQAANEMLQNTNNLR